MRTRFILIETSHAGNVGSVARAMKVMGFDDLVLVRPRWADVLQREEALALASGADDVLARARIVPTLDEALDGVSHVCATAMTPRDFGPPTVAPRAHLAELAARLLSPAAASLGVTAADPAGQADGVAPTASVSAVPTGVAFLFGSERYGMKNEDVYRSHACLCIPTAPDYGSLNLAAAVQLIAYEWRQALGGFALPASGAPQPRAADAQAVAGLLAHWEQALVAVGFLDPAAPRKLLPRLNQLCNRAEPTEEEIHILRGVARAMLQTAAQARR
ncbi:rRNA methyltransferase [Malikia spinosa]|uniref:rRNA methyltransferase n=1 Tax=Malikia spinosa TaxID=86180 RepID=A0A2S9KC81_9BURK|nr:RNA methyltransferase [Malikia spinosa]PRD68048.1 rRNA methyltransferase [Malikia spinosa]